MLRRIRLLLVYGTLVTLYSCNEKYAACSGKLVADSVRNVSVRVLLEEQQQQQQIAETKGAYEYVKLNVSWLPPNSVDKQQPSSYSIIVTSASTKERTSKIRCPDGMFFRTVKSNEKLYAVVPANDSLAGIPDLYIRPGCSYKVQVIANPRSKQAENVSEIFYTVPACLDRACSCVNDTTFLPTPRLNVTRKEGDMVVQWSTNPNASSNVRLYTISLGIPLLVSRKGLPVYNITRLGQVSGDKSVFSWNPGSNGQQDDTRNGYKVIVTAIDHRGCPGPEGSYATESVQRVADTSMPWHVWLVLIVVIIGCTFCGVSSLAIKCRENGAFTLNRTENTARVHGLSNCKSQRGETILRKRNVLYVGHESEATGSDEETDKLRVPFDSVKLVRELGTGQFGKVYLGRLNDTNRTLVAVKMSQKPDVSGDPETRQQFIKEIEIMRMAGSHPHLVRLVGHCTRPNDTVCILVEYMQGGDLFRYLQDKRKHRCDDAFGRVASGTTTDSTNSRASERWIGRLEGRLFLKFGREIAMGMEHLESKGITHRDLAARNVLLDADFTAKISDFGLSRNGVYVIKNVGEKTRHLPIRWMSPEALHSRAFTSKSDVWSFGIVLWEMSTLGAFPYASVQDDRLLRYIVRENGRLERPDDVPATIYELMLSCWATEAERRPSFAQLVWNLGTLSTALDSAVRTVSNPCYAFADRSEAV